MRLATYFTSIGDTVALIRRPRLVTDPPGECFGSTIFTSSAARRRRADQEWGHIRWGGTGISPASNLSDIDASVDWDRLPLDYSIYPEFKPSIGFTQRGCRLSCGFCVVPRKEGRPRTVASAYDIWRGNRHPRQLLLLDNDFFGQPTQEWQARVSEFAVGQFRVCFSQGINIRMITEDSAAALARIEYRDNEFRRRRLYTAWDNLGDENAFKTGAALLAKAGVPPRHLMVYMLVGFRPAETFAEILYRFDALVALGCKPYPMVYDATRADLKAFQRWAVTGLYRAVPWREYRDPRVNSH